MIRPFQEARELDAAEVECWRMFGAEPPRWEEAIRQAPRPVVLTLEQFYAHIDAAMTGLLTKTDIVNPDRAETNLAKIVCFSSKGSP